MAYFAGAAAGAKKKNNRHQRINKIMLTGNGNEHLQASKQKHGESGKAASAIINGMMKMVCSVTVLMAREMEPS